MSFPVPKRLGGGSLLNASQRRSKMQEKETATRLGGRVTKASGAGGFEKADVRVKGLLRIEAKTTKHKSFSVTAEMLDKIENQATIAGELPVMEIEIEGGKRRVYVLPTWALDGLIQQVQQGAPDEEQLMGLLKNLIRYNTTPPQGVTAPAQGVAPIVVQPVGYSQSNTPTPETAPAPPPVRSSIVNPSDAQPILSQTYLTDLVDAQDRRPERSRSGGTNGYMHVSSLISLDCERQSALISQYDADVKETVTGGHRIMWAQGRATETHIRDAIIDATGGTSVYGRWECRCGYANHLGTKPDQELVCHTCGHPLNIYKEPTQIDEDCKLTGSPDLSVWVSGFMVVTEIKSMTPDQFDALKAPLPDHVHQAVMYREMYQRAGFRVHDKVVILYGRKQFLWGGKNKVYKEFHVDATTRGLKA